MKLKTLQVLSISVFIVLQQQSAIKHGSAKILATTEVRTSSPCRAKVTGFQCHIFSEMRF